MPPIWILAIFAISCTTTILEICHASEAEFDMNRLGKLGIENPFYPESCKSTCPENSPESFGKVLTLLGLGLIKINNVSANFDNPMPSLILNN